MTDLQVSVESQDGLQRTIRVQVPAGRIEQEIESRLQNVGRSARLKGFRPGKVPASVIRKRYGGQVRQEVLQEVLQSSYSEAIDREQLRPAGGPKIEPEAIDEGQDLTYTATFEIYPEIQLAGLDQLKISRPETPIEDTDVDEMIETLRKQRGTWNAVEQRKAADGDRITIDFEGRLKGEVFEGGQGEKIPIVLGAGQMLPDFEKQLLGLAAGDEKSFKLKFPKDYHSEDLAGKKVSFDVQVLEVAESELPELDTEFVRAFGIESGELDEFRADVKRNMEREVVSRVEADVKRQAMEQLLAANPIDVPDVLVDQEAASLQADSMRSMGIEDPAQAARVETFREPAIRRVRLGLLVGAVIRDNALAADRERVKQKVDEMCASYQDPDEVRKLYFQNPQLLGQIENLVLEEQVVEWLVTRADVESKATGFKDLMGG